MLLRSIALAFVLAPSSLAQCAEWKEGFALSGLGSELHSGRAAVAHDDGSGLALYVGGHFDGADAAGRPYLARWNGSEWSSVGGGVDGGVNALQSFDDGSGAKLFAGGVFSNAGGVSASGVARWDGSSWSALGDLAGYVWTLAVHDDGAGARLYAAGNLSVGGDALEQKVVRWNGAAWTTLGRPSAAVRGMLSHDDGSGPALVLIGDFLSISGVSAVRLGRYRAGAWESIGGGGVDGLPLALASFDDGGGAKLYVGGAFPSIAGTSVSSLGVWNGATWSAFPASATTVQYVNALAVHDDGAGPKLHACGSFVQSGTTYRALRWDGAAWQRLGLAGPSYEPTALASVVDGAGAALVVLGIFRTVEDVPADGVALWRGGSWSPVGAERSVRGPVLALTRGDVGNGQQLFVGGDFVYAGGVRSNNVAVWDGTSFQPLAQGVGGRVRSLCVFDDGSGAKLYAGTTLYGGNPASHVLDVWDGASWTEIPLANSYDVPAMCVHDDGTGPALYVAAKSTANTVTIRKFDGTTWTTSYGATAPTWSVDAVSTLASYDDGSGAKLYAGGEFTTIGGVDAAYLARFDGSAWSRVGDSGSPQYVIGSGVYALAVSDLGAGSKLYVGGKFISVAGTAVENIAAWDGAWSALPSADGTQPDRVRALATFDAGGGRGPALCVGGSLRPDGGAAMEGLALWNGSAYASLEGLGAVSSSGVRAVHALAVFDDGVDAGDDLFAGGAFAEIEGVPSCRFARFEGCGETGATFCFGDGSAAACPCGNASAVGARAGCLSSLGIGATLRARGAPSLGGDTLVLDGAAMPNSSVLYFQGASLAGGGFGVAFGDGIRCVNGPFVRLGTKVNAAGASSYPLASDASISVRGFVSSPGTRHYSARYRNAATFCTSDTFNTANAVTIVWRL